MNLTKLSGFAVALGAVYLIVRCIRHIIWVLTFVPNQYGWKPRIDDEWIWDLFIGFLILFFLYRTRFWRKGSGGNESAPQVTDP